MDIKPYMSKAGFSRGGFRQLVIEQDGKLWLAFASQGAASFMSSSSQSSGLLEIGALSSGEQLAYQYSVSESLITITTEKGSMRIAIDKEANALRFEGEGIALRLDAKSAPQHATSLNTPGGVELTIGGGRFFFVSRKGTISFDDSWIRNQFHSTTPVLDLAPDNGKFDLVAYDLPADTDVPVITKSLDECIKETEADFKAFCETLVSTPAEWDDVREKIAYILWINHKTNPDGAEIIVQNKLAAASVESWLLALASLAFKDVKKCIGFITALPVSSPPLHGLAALRLIDDGLLQNLSRSTLYKLYETLGASARWWKTDRCAGEGELSFYAYRFETGLKAPAVFSAGEPAVSPDLNTYLILQNEALAHIADHVYDGGMGARYREQAGKLRAALIASLWNCETFTGMNVYSGMKSEPDALLSYMPLILGKRLPFDIAAKLSEKLDESAINTALGALVIMGLKDSGQDGQAKRITAQMLKDVRENGIGCPFYGAALIALAHKTL